MAGVGIAWLAMTWRSGFPTGRHRRPLAWAIAGGLIALVACAQDAGEGVDVPTRPSSLPASTTTTEIGVELTRECVTTSAGYKVRYPDSWFVNDPGQAAACRFFHPEPFDVPPGTEATGIAISLNVEPTPFAVLALGPEGSVATTVRARVETTVAGRAAVRVDITSTGEGLLPSGTEGLLYFVDFGESTFVARTYGSPAAGTLASNAAVLDQMMGTLARMDSAAWPPVLRWRRGARPAGAGWPSRGCRRHPPGDRRGRGGVRLRCFGGARQTGR